MKQSILQRARRAFRSPYADEPALIVHCSHHKAGSVWLSRILRAVARTYGLRAFFGEQRELPQDADLFVQNHSLIDCAELPSFRGSHMIRDPRDVIVSGYFYHLKTDEPWVHVPSEKYGGRSYQQHLNSLTKEAGLFAEIERCTAYDISAMISWNYQDDRFLELRYENLIADEAAGFGRLFQHYGFNPSAIDRCVDIAMGFNIEKARTTTKHIRSGVPGDWRNHFKPAHIEVFKSLLGDAAFRLGYETDRSW